MAKNDPVIFDCPDPLSSKYPEDANAPHHCKVCDTWKQRSKFSRKYAPENVCRKCAPSYADSQRKIAAKLWEMYDNENSNI
jgi:hypothetical protein